MSVSISSTMSASSEVRLRSAGTSMRVAHLAVSAATVVRD
ncbi:Uncharacterised protein [Mycobacteroides abscessus subsp. abscessus]|nr:Uncharacterised protein [Mycobacteroides abscessus subsp. abscessus]